MKLYSSEFWCDIFWQRILFRVHSMYSWHKWYCLAHPCLFLWMFVFTAIWWYHLVAFELYPCIHSIVLSIINHHVQKSATFFCRKGSYPRIKSTLLNPFLLSLKSQCSAYMSELDLQRRCFFVLSISDNNWLRYCRIFQSKHEAARYWVWQLRLTTQHCTERIKKSIRLLAQVNRSSPACN